MILLLFLLKVGNSSDLCSEVAVSGRSSPLLSVRARPPTTHHPPLTHPPTPPTNPLLLARDQLREISAQQLSRTPTDPNRALHAGR